MDVSPEVFAAGAKDSVVNAPVFGVVLPIALGLAKSTLAPPPKKAICYASKMVKLEAVTLDKI